MRKTLVLWAMLAVGAVAVAAPKSVVRDGGFEASRPDAISLSWSVTGEWAIDAQIAHSGKHSLRAEIPADSANTYAGAVHNLPVQPGKTYTCAVWMRAADVRLLAGGGFAFAAIYQFDRADQLVTFNDFAQATGTQDWTRYTYTFTVKGRAERVAIHCGLYHARGTVWFDDFVVTAGAVAPEWSPALEVDSMAQPREAAVAIFKDDLPSSGAASSPDDLASLLREAGIHVGFLDSEGLADPGQLNVDRFNLVVLPYGASFPAAAAKTFQYFLAAGGDFISAGGYAFDNLLERTPRGWQSQERAIAAAARVLPLGGDFEGEIRWKTDSPKWAQVVSDVSHSGKRSARVSLPPGEQGAEWYQDITPTPGKVLQITAWVKASAVRREGGGFAFAAAYLFDAQGNRLDWRDYAVVTEKQDWRRYTAEFTPPPNCARLRLRIGFWGSSGTAWFDDVTATERDPMVRLNTRHGDPQDGLQVSPRQIGVFDPSYRLQRAVSAAAAPGGPLDSALRWRGPLEGYAACAVTGTDEARWTPLINACDRFGRLRGAVGSLTRHYAGVYRGSSWACFGVTNQDIFAKDRARDGVVPLVRYMLREIYMHDAATDWACYREGENVKLSVRVSNFGPEPRDVLPTARVIPIRPDDRDGEPAGDFPAAAASVPAGATTSFEMTWPAGGPGLYRVDIELGEGGEVTDTMATGYVVKDPAPAGPEIAWRDNYLTLEGKPRFLLGTDTYGNMFWSANQNPWTWDQVAQKMRAHQVLVFENLQVNPEAFALPYVADERFLRQAEAVTQVAARHGLIYDAGLLIGFNVLADDAKLAQQAAWCKQWAERMRDVPGLLHCINGDLQLSYAEPDQSAYAGQAALWQRWLKEKYGDIAALNAAWKLDKPLATFDDIPLAPASPRGWDDLRARDRRLFEIAMVQRWLGALNRALKDVDPAPPVTVEFYQTPFGGIDPRAGLDALDIGNIGYFGLKGEDIGRFPATFAFTDMRATGQGLSVGEFGVKTHPAWESVHNYHTTRTEAEQFDLFLALPHYAFGLGGCKVQNWCWEDADENIFPWGLSYPNDRVSKEALDVYRNVGLLLGRFEPVYGSPAAWLVVPTSHRLSAASGQQVYDAMRRAIDALIRAHAPFAVIDEDRLNLLPPEAKALFWPAPFCPGDETYGAVLDFVRRGGTVYVSGDFSFDPDRQRTRADRLEELAGVGFVKQNYAGLAAPESTAPLARIARPFGALKPWPTLPCIQIESRGAEVLAEAGGSPVLVSNAVGSGRVIFCADIPEARAETGPALTALYRAVLASAGVERIGIEPDREEVHAFAIPTRPGGTVYVLYNTDTKRAHRVQLRTPHGRFALTLGPDKPGLIALAKNGELLAVEAGGEVARDGRPVAEADCQFTWYTDRDADLSRAAGSTLTTLTPGRVRLRASAAPVRAFGWDAGQLRQLEELKTPRNDEWLTVNVDGDLARQLIVLGDMPPK